MSPFNLGSDTSELGVGQHNNLEIVEAVPGVSQKGNETLRVTVENSDGAQITEWLTALPTVRWKWRQLWEAARLSWPSDGQVDENELIGRRVACDVHEETYNGETRPRVKEFFPVIPSSDIPSDWPEPEAEPPAAADDDDEAPF